MRMYTKKTGGLAIAMMTMVLIVCSSATAAVTELLGSTSFDWQYEFDFLPTTQDLDGNGVSDFTIVGDAGTLNGDGTWTMDTIASNSSYFYAGSADQIWAQSGITWETGYTMEARIRVNSTAEETVLGTLYMHAVPESESGASSWLNLSDNVVSWGLNRSPSLERNNSDDFHVFRLAQEPGTGAYTVWCDDELLVENLSSGYSNAALNRLILGDPGAAHGGTADVDYLRFTSGAYAPANMVVAAPPTTQKASSEFTYQYEMDVDPTDAAQIDLDSNTFADWGAVGAGNVSLSGNGTLIIDSNGGADAFLDSGIYDANNVWPVGNFTVEDGFTVEISVKLDASNTDMFGLNAAPSDSFAFPYFSIRPDGQGWSNETISLGEEGVVYDNTDDFHVFRLVHNPMADGGKWFVWRDGDLLTPDGLNSSLLVDRNALYFGDLGRAEQVIAEVDYIRFMEGAFAPVEVTPDIAGDANGDGKVDGSDVTILAGNWQKGVSDGLTASWEEGDFNDDGKVDGSDVTILAGNWQYGVEAAAASVPEPSTLALLLTAMACFMIQRRK